MLTNALRFIKYNFLKFLLTILLLLIFLLAGLFFRVSYKPININFISKYIGKDNLNYIIPFENLENAKLQFNLLKNVVSINFYELANYEFKDDKSGLSINIAKAEEINIGLIATKLFKRKIELSFINFNNTEANLSLKKNISDLSLNSIKKTSNFLFPNKLKFLGSELSISFINNKQQIISKNVNAEITNKKGTYEINNFSAEKIIFFAKNKKSLEFIKPFISIKNDIFEGYTKEVKIFSNENKEINKILYKLNITYDDLKFADANFKYYLEDKFIIKSNVLYKGIDVPVEITGNFTNDFFVNARLDLDFKGLSLSKELQELKLLNNITLKNFDEALLEGAVSIEIFNSKFLAGSFVVKSNNEDTFSLKYNDTYFPINNFLINASIIEEQVEIERLLISNANDKIEIEGKIENLFKDVNAILNVNITKLDISNFSNLIYKKTDNFFSSSYKISNIESGQLENTKFKLLYNKEVIDIEKFNGKLTNAKFLLKDDYTIKADNVYIISKKNNNILLTTPSLFFNKNGKTIAFLDNNLELENIFNPKTLAFYYKANIDTGLKNLSKFLHEIKSISKISTSSENFSGNINTTVLISYSAVKEEKIKYNLIGKISKLNLINNDEFPITFRNFNGDFKFKNNTLEINGNAFLNNSKSDIDIKIDKNYKLLININSLAIFSSFDFLNDYNFLESGTSKLKLKIEKENFYNDNWTAYLSADLYNNHVIINEVVYEKREKTQGLLEAEFNFENLTLQNVKNLTFITDDILIRGDISLGNSGDINKIKVHEFKRQLDDFSANINLLENDYFTLDVSGRSININNFFSESNNSTLYGKVNILVENLFFNNLNLGNTKISSEIYKNKMVRLDGKIYNNKKEHTYFNYILNKNKNSELKLTFIDSGLFLKNTEISDKFISGNGHIVFVLDNQSNQVKRGEYFIKDFSIKDASFLARLLQLASFTGLLEILASEGIPFTNLNGSFKIEDSILKIEKTRFEGLSLGASVSGNINLESQDLQLEGVLIPAYAINAILNKIPVLGKIITGVDGEGIIGFNYKVAGSYKNPDYTINPFSILTPGIVRNIFKIFGNDISNEDIEKDSLLN